MTTFARERLTLPFYPVSGVVVPYGRLAVAVLQPLFRRLVDDCLAEEAPLATTGFGPDGPEDVGCVAWITHHREEEFGLVVLLEGRMRVDVLDVLRLHEGAAPYRFADVRARPDTDDDPAALAAARLALRDRFLPTLPPAARADPRWDAVFAGDPPGAASFAVLDHIAPTPEHNAARLELLRMDSELERLRRVAAMLEAAER